MLGPTLLAYPPYRFPSDAHGCVSVMWRWLRLLDSAPGCVCVCACVYMDGGKGGGGCSCPWTCMDAYVCVWVCVEGGLAVAHGCVSVI